MRLTRVQKCGLVVLIGCAASLAFAWIGNTQREFETELKRVAGSELDYLVLCSFLATPKPQPCKTLQRGRDKQFAAAIGLLSSATSSPRPNKVSTASDAILKLGRGSPEAKEYVACLRATTYSGIDRIFISPMGTDAECTWPTKYHAGLVAIPLDAFGEMR